MIYLSPTPAKPFATKAEKGSSLPPKPSQTVKIGSASDRLVAPPHRPFRGRGGRSGAPSPAALVRPRRLGRLIAAAARGLLVGDGVVRAAAEAALVLVLDLLLLAEVRLVRGALLLEEHADLLQRLALWMDWVMGMAWRVASAPPLPQYMHVCIHREEGTAIHLVSQSSHPSLPA